MRRIIIPLIVLVVAGLTATVALANVNLHNESFSTSQPTPGVTVLTMTGTLTGLGNLDTLIVLSATADVIGTITCTSPGGNDAPGQQGGTVLLGGVQPLSSSEIKNGNVDFNVSTGQPSAKQLGCPNNNWSASGILDFTSATLTVYQGPRCATATKPGPGCNTIVFGPQTFPNPA